MSDLGPEVVNYVSHASQTRLQNLLEKVSEVAQQRNINFKVCTVLCFICIFSMCSYGLVLDGE